MRPAGPPRPDRTPSDLDRRPTHAPTTSPPERGARQHPAHPPIRANVGPACETWKPATPSVPDFIGEQGQCSTTNRSARPSLRPPKRRPRSHESDQYSLSLRASGVESRAGLAPAIRPDDQRWTIEVERHPSERARRVICPLPAQSDTRLLSGPLSRQRNRRPQQRKDGEHGLASARVQITG